MTPFWSDIYKIFTFAFTKGPLDKQGDTSQLRGAGSQNPAFIPDVRNIGAYGGNSAGLIPLIESNDFIDLSTITNRTARYKEYLRLMQSMPEIDMVMTVLADEACVAGKTLIETLFHGQQRIDWLAKHKQGQKFPVYCYDFAKEDYTIGWAFDPRFVKRAKTITIVFDNGKEETVTEDHRVLLRNGNWIQAGSLTTDMQLMPFYRIKPNSNFSHIKHNQFPRIYSHKKGWIHERQFIDEWKANKEIEKFIDINMACRFIANGGTYENLAKKWGCTEDTARHRLEREGFCYKELHYLGKKEKTRNIIQIRSGPEIDVYDLSVEDHENFCTSNMVMHNCQKNSKDRIFEVKCKNKDVVEEVEYLLYNRKRLNLTPRKVWSASKHAFAMGDYFAECIIDPDNPQNGICKLNFLPPESMYRIETNKGILVEFQQSNEGPDYAALTRAPITKSTESELIQTNAVRFTPQQIMHIRIGEDKGMFYPYGKSLIEPARGVAHQLKLMEDSMIVYRLSRSPERRVFYIDTQELSPARAEAFMEKLKDQFRKKKTVSSRGGNGPNSVDEKFFIPPPDVDIFMPIRPNSASRIETLPGASNLGEIDDTLYFRNKVFVALNFPTNYFSNEDPSVTRITLSATNIKFARMVERLQSYIEDGYTEVAHRHLELVGFPEEYYEDLELKMTPPSEWKELSRAEIENNRMTAATSIKGAGLWSDFDIQTRIFKFSKEEAEEIVSRMKIQKMEDIKLQIIAQDASIVGVGQPGNADQPEIGAEPGGPGQMPQLPQEQPPEVNQKQEAIPANIMPDAGQAKPLPVASEEDIVKYDLQIQDYQSDMDVENIDHSENYD